MGFSEKICKLIGAHVDAKRYLTYIHPNYYKNLSDASKKTLEYQGGSMSTTEAVQFEADPLFNLYIRMRLWDEAAKGPSVSPMDLGLFKEKIIKHLSKDS